ncbi:B12-binding domain-containing radical SAM protein [Polyangium aurulentum]|uniref:B12-binding domain-containing radical SAM protein n=1 Tax=Polyangium aurulentum TaxID=2567896 RepID=UPI00146D222E|nr:radical SAM protein [Polyangium aurulentum]UQA60192.1 B12-binding domain-containing radical SAM protein [Polyangium aurulentum]
MADARAKRQPIVVAVAGKPEAATASLGPLARLGKAARVVSVTAAEAVARAGEIAARLRDGCLVIGADVPPADARVLAERAGELDVRTVLAEGLAAALADMPAAHVIDAGARVLSPAFLALVEEVRRESMGPLVGLAVRSPAGRRLHRPASTRTPFVDGARIDFDLDDATKTRIARALGDAFTLADAALPGAARALEVTEVVASPGADRIALHACLDRVAIEVEIDEEMRGEGPIEVEAVMARGALVCRWSAGGASLTRKALLRDGQAPLEARPPPLEVAVRHAIAQGSGERRAKPSPASLAGAEASRGLAGEAIARYGARARSRPIEMVLVHVPRYRNSYDELELPSLATARLAAWTRGHGFVTRVFDLQIAHGDDPLGCFADDAAVDAWLAGEARPEVEGAVNRLWSTLGPPLLEARALGRRCLVGLSIVDYFGHFQMNIAACLARRVKRETGFPTVLGGERDQVDGDRALALPNTFDYVVDGDGEVPLLGLLHREAYGDRRAADIGGVWSREGERVTKNKLVRSHLNAMPRPDFDDVPMHLYLGPPTARLLAALAGGGLYNDEPIEPFAYLPYGFVKGCTAKCEFCSAKEWLDVQSPEKSVDELLRLSERYGVRDFVFLDNLVNVGPRLLERFCRLLIDSKAGLQWTDSCRPTDISAELAAAMREAGCLLLNYGAESGSDKILTLMKKGLLSRDIVETLRNTHRAGIINRVNFIAGYLHETEEDVDATIGLVETLAEEIDIIGCFQGFYLFPGMGVDPAQAGITLRPELDRLKTGQVTLAYDEIGGMRWEDKRDAIDASRNRILARMEDLGIRTLDKINEYDLFWMSRRFDKATVTRYLLEAPPRPASRKNQGPLPPGGQRGRVEAAR